MKLAQNPQKHLEDYNGVYSATNNPLESGVACNGLGWLPDSGFADEVVSLAVDGPEFVELRVSERRAFYGDLARKDTYNAVIDGSPLSFVAAERENDQLKLLFSVPTAIRKRDADEFLFLSFADSYHREDRHSERILHSVRWR